MRNSKRTVLSTALVALFTTLLAGAFAGVSQRSPAPAAAPLTYSRDIAPLFNKNCVSCHRKGEVGPFSLASYAEVKKRAAQIALVVDRRIMPPWKLDSHGEFQGERRLTDREISTIKQWVAEGAAQGRQSDLPPAPTFPTTWALGKPDLLLQPATDYHLASEGRDVYRCFVIPTHFDEDRYVSAIDINPGNRAVVHHVLVYLDTEGRARKMDSKESEPGYSTGGGIGFLPSGMLGGWAPGAMPTHLPKETGILLPKGADVVLEVHYHKDGKPEIDRSQVALYFSKQPVERPLHLFPLANLGIRIPADKKDHEEKASLVVPLGVTLYTLFPHMHNLGKQMSVTATLPGGTKKQLIHIPDWDFNWQGFYAYKQPVPLPAGTRVDLVAHYDNSADNPLNPNSPPKDLTWGEQTSDEMCLCFLGFTVDIERLPQKPVGNQIKNASSIQPTTDSRKPLETEAVGQSDSVAPSDPLAAAKGKKALVLFFVGTDCPISNAYAPEIKRISDSYKRQNIAFALVYPDPDLSLMEAKKHAKAYGYTCPVFIDPSHRLTRQAGATLTPQVAVLAPGGSVLYRGRINNLYVDFGKRRFEATQHDLRSALDAIVAGKAVRERFTNAIGCFIPEKK